MQLHIISFRATHYSVLPSLIFLTLAKAIAYFYCKCARIYAQTQEQADRIDTLSVIYRCRTSTSKAVSPFTLYLPIFVVYILVIRRVGRSKTWVATFQNPAIFTVQVHIPQPLPRWCHIDECSFFFHVFTKTFFVDLNHCFKNNWHT